MSAYVGSKIKNNFCFNSTVRIAVRSLPTSQSFYPLSYLLRDIKNSFRFKRYDCEDSFEYFHELSDR